MATKSTTLRPRGATPSNAGVALGWVAVPWLFAVLVAVGAAREASGSAGTAGPVLALLVFSVAVTPGVLFLASSALGKVPGFRWLLAEPQPSVILDADGIQVRLPGVDVRQFRWDDVAGMQVRRTWSRTWGELLGMDGAVLTTIPFHLVYLKETWSTAPTLAQKVVEAQPDRYVLTGADSGTPDAFFLVGHGVEPLDVRAVERQRRILVWGLISILAVFGIVAAIVFYAQPS